MSLCGRQKPRSDLSQVRRAKVDLINKVAAHLKEKDITNATERECATFAFARNSKTLAAFDRYERRLLARRNRALRKLASSRATQERLRAAAERSQAAQQVGPPLTKQHVRDDLFAQNVMPLRLGDFVKSVVKSGFKSARGSVQHPIGNISIFITIGNNTGRLILHFNANDEAVVQEFAMVRKSVQVGGGSWLIQCPETKKLVRYLFLAGDQRRFRSHHALRLTYRSNSISAEDRPWVRCFKLMYRIGATDFFDLPPRPKHMHPRTYRRICNRLNEAVKFLRRSLVRDQLLFRDSR